MQPSAQHARSLQRVVWAKMYFLKITPLIPPLPSKINQSAWYQGLNPGRAKTNWFTGANEPGLDWLNYLALIKSMSIIYLPQSIMRGKMGVEFIYWTIAIKNRQDTLWWQYFRFYSIETKKKRRNWGNIYRVCNVKLKIYKILRRHSSDVTNLFIKC